MPESEKREFVLSNKKVMIIYCYLSFLLLIGIGGTVICLNHSTIFEKLSITMTSLIGGASTALVGSSIFYIRKLYKNAISGLFNESVDKSNKAKESGLFMYYLLRPIFAVSFSIIFHIGLKASVVIVTVKETNLSEGMICLTMILSFFIGFATGDVVSIFENYSKDKLKKVIERM